MLIFNKKLSVSPITTHLAIKDVHKNITKQKIMFKNKSKIMPNQIQIVLISLSMDPYKRKDKN